MKEDEGEMKTNELSVRKLLTGRIPVSGALQTPRAPSCNTISKNTTYRKRRRRRRRKIKNKNKGHKKQNITTIIKETNTLPLEAKTKRRYHEKQRHKDTTTRSRDTREAETQRHYHEKQRHKDTREVETQRQSRHGEPTPEE